jgi:hypothetical protein
MVVILEKVQLADKGEVLEAGLFGSTISNCQSCWTSNRIAGSAKTRDRRDGRIAKPANWVSLARAYAWEVFFSASAIRY